MPPRIGVEDDSGAGDGITGGRAGDDASNRPGTPEAFRQSSARGIDAGGIADPAAGQLVN